MPNIHGFEGLLPDGSVPWALAVIVLLAIVSGVSSWRSAKRLKG